MGVTQVIARSSRTAIAAARVVFYKGVEPRYVLDRVDVEEWADAVAFTVFVGCDPEAQDEACIEIAKLTAVDAPLEEPLGNREVIDAS